MSGPKVTRVVTKREVMSICQGRMEALRNAIDEWRRCAARYDALTRQKEQEIELDTKILLGCRARAVPQCTKTMLC